jgi:hypothetical protein
MARYDLASIGTFGDKQRVVIINTTDSHFLAWAKAQVRELNPKGKVAWESEYSCDLETHDPGTFKWFLISELAHKGWEPYAVTLNSSNHITHSFRRKSID